MENRFIEHSRRLSQPARTRAPHAAWATPFSAADRALVVLIENGGVDLGIPALVDKLLASIPGAGAISETRRQSVVTKLYDDLLSFTDGLLETAELTLNRYASAKPELYGEVSVLRDGTASYQDVKAKLLALASAGRVVDLFVLTHGDADRISVAGGIDAQKIRAMKDELGKPLTLRGVYMMDAVGAALNQPWLDAGAQVAAGVLRNNYLPEPTLHFFWKNWKDGVPFESAVNAAYRMTIRWLNDNIPRLVTDLPISPAGGWSVEHLGVVKDSAPVVQGRLGVTVTSDELVVSPSRSLSLATTVLPAAFLRTLSEEPAAGAPKRSLSPAGVELIKRWELFRERMYNDPVGHCTIGYGTLLHRGNCDGSASEQPYVNGISEAKATELLMAQTAQSQQVIDDTISVPLTQSQNDALVSFVYNVGDANFRKSTLLRVLNEGKYDAVPGELRKWTKATDTDGRLVELPGLVKRRDAEAEMFARPDGGLSTTQFLPTFVAGEIAFSDAAQIGLAGISVAQAQVAMPGGSFSLSYDAAQRLLLPDARVQLTGAQSKQTYERELFRIHSWKPGWASATVTVRWEGNAYGEISTPIIERDLDKSTDWSHSSAELKITHVQPIPEDGSDPRAWPIAYHYNGAYDPWGKGMFEFNGDFEINAFGGLVFKRPRVISRSAADFTMIGKPEDYVERGADVIAPVPTLPADQLDLLKHNLNIP